MKSTRRNMVLSLGLITLVSATSLGVVYELTKGSIEDARNSATIKALSLVIADFDNNPAQEITEITLDDLPIRVFTGTKNGQPSGYAVETITRVGYSGDIRMMVGFTPDGEVHNIVVLEHNETPGLGSKIADPGNPLLVSFAGRNPADMNLTLRMDGGDVDAITASTISSRAYIDAVERAFRAFQQVALGIVGKSVNHVAAVLPAHDRVSSQKIVIGQDTVIVNTATRGGSVVGYAVQAETPNGYHGTIRLMVGFLPDGTINDIAVMKQSETPGFGAVIEQPDNVLAVGLRGRNANEIRFGLKPAADGASGATGKSVEPAKEGDVDGITGSTVTSNAYIEAVELAFRAFVTLKDHGR